MPVSMSIGLLWYDADAKKATQIKIDEAAERFAQKHRELPNLCFVHPSQIVEHKDLKVEGNPYIQPNNFMVGIEEGTTAKPYDVEPVLEEVRPRRRKSA